MEKKLLSRVVMNVMHVVIRDPETGVNSDLLRSPPLDDN